MTTENGNGTIESEKELWDALDIGISEQRGKWVEENPCDGCDIGGPYCQNCGTRMILTGHGIYAVIQACCEKYLCPRCEQQEHHYRDMYVNYSKNGISEGHSHSISPAEAQTWTIIEKAGRKVEEL